MPTFDCNTAIFAVRLSSLWGHGRRYNWRHCRHITATLLFSSQFISKLITAFQSLSSCLYTTKATFILKFNISLFSAHLLPLYLADILIFRQFYIKCQLYRLYNIDYIISFNIWLYGEYRLVMMRIIHEMPPTHALAHRFGTCMNGHYRSGPDLPRNYYIFTRADYLLSLTTNLYWRALIAKSQNSPSRRSKNKGRHDDIFLIDTAFIITGSQINLYGALWMPS